MYLKNFKRLIKKIKQHILIKLYVTNCIIASLEIFNGIYNFINCVILKIKETIKNFKIFG